MKTKFEKYARTNLAEMRPYVEGETLPKEVSVSAEDEKAGSPKIGDMIARNPDNHKDQWLVAEDYFKANFAPLGEGEPTGKKSNGNVQVDSIRKNGVVYKRTITLEKS